MRSFLHVVSSLCVIYLLILFFFFFCDYFTCHHCVIKKNIILQLGASTKTFVPRHPHNFMQQLLLFLPVASKKCKILHLDVMITFVVAVEPLDNSKQFCFPLYGFEKSGFHLVCFRLWFNDCKSQHALKSVSKKRQATPVSSIIHVFHDTT